MSRPLGSAPTSRQQGLHSYYGPVRRRTPHRYSVPTVSASARSLSRPEGQTGPETAAISTLAFSRSVQEQQTRLTPRGKEGPPVSVPSQLFDASTTTPSQVTPTGRFWYVFLVPT